MSGKLPDWKRTLPGAAEHWAQQIGADPWLPYAWCVYLADKIVEHLRRPEGGRLIVTCPPRHGKSTLASHFLPAYFLEAFPERRVILGSYGASLAREWGRKVRDLFEHPATDTWVQVRPDKRAASEWETSEGGGMLTAGVGGPITGKGFNLGLIDDPFKSWEEAQSPLAQTRVQQWYQSTFATRREPGASIIVTQTRWHQNDLAGWLLDQHADDWEVVNLPALAESGDPMGRAEGAALCPERWPVRALEQTRAGLAPVIWLAMYQQHPVPPEGQIVHNTWIKHWGTLPDHWDKLIQSWDMSFKDLETSSYVVGQVWGLKGANAYLLDQVRERMDFVSTIAAVERLTAAWPDAAEKLVEDKANGTAVISVLKSKVPGLVPVNPQGSKVARLYAVSPYFESGNIWIPPAQLYPWVNEWIGEMTTFPGSIHDDQVDSTSQALSRLFGRRRASDVEGLAIPDMSQANPWSC